jgi:hypothetical protein
MGIGTVVRFLFGDRQAIVDIATSRCALWVGGLFVLSAGFAREYNQEDLLHGPWYLMVPLAASLATSLVLFALLALAANFWSTTTVPFLPYYRAFLSLYWMTAPLAWLYALPVENYLSAADSVRVNLSLLGIVSLWRVLLITRAAAVLFGASYLAVFFLVMLFADTVALVALYFSPLPIINVMGGISHTESESVIINAALMVGFFGGITWLVWLIASIVVLSFKSEWTPLDIDSQQSHEVAKPLWALAIASLLIWVMILPRTQPAQQLRRQAESDLLDSRVEVGLQLMTAHDRDDFPPHWDPPPWPGYGQKEPHLEEVVDTLQNLPSMNWVVDIYRDKITRQINRTYDEDHKTRLRELLEKLDVDEPDR